MLHILGSGDIFGRSGSVAVNVCDGLAVLHLEFLSYLGISLVYGNDSYLIAVVLVSGNEDIVCR